MISTLFLFAFVQAVPAQSTPAREVATERGVRVVRPKPAHTVLSPWVERDVIRVKFHDDLVVRARDGALDDFGTAALGEARPTLTRFAGGTWRPEHTQPEEWLDELRATAMRNSGEHIADLNLQLRFELPAGVSAEDAIDAFNRLDCVEIALPTPKPVPQPAVVVGDYQDRQGYLEYAPGGLNHRAAWSIAGGTGGWKKIADIEYSYNASHAELGGVARIMPAGATAVADPFNDTDHGTAVLGELAPPRDGFGVTGASHGSSVYFVPARTTNAAGTVTWSVANAITAARTILSAGDVILIEQQFPGPLFAPMGCCSTTCPNDPSCQFGLVPWEWDLFTYNTIRTAVASGVHVVEAACNGSQNLDAAGLYNGNGADGNPVNNGHHPFVPANDSGAILVGAGASPGGSDTDRSRLSFSNYGSTVDLQGWGENVTTCGYGDLYNADGVDFLYTSRFGGTSGAAPLVAAACAQVSSVYRSYTGTNIIPAALRNLLRSTGSAQQAGAFPVAQNIGPRPNVPAAIQVAGFGQAAHFGPGTYFCPGDGFNINCPCGNNSPVASGRGCQNSLARGAMLVAAGVPSIGADSLTLMGTDMPPSSALYFQGTGWVSLGIGAVFGDGLRCAGGNVIRLGTVWNAADGSSIMPRPGQPPISVQGQIAQPGWRFYQVWYRNAAAFCTAATFNLTNGVRVQWAN